MDIIFATEEALLLQSGQDSTRMQDVPDRKYLEIHYEHRFMTGREAYELGMINRVFPTYEILEKETLAFADRVASQPPSHLRNIKAGVLNKHGLAGAYNGRPGFARSDVPADERNAQRYEGRGMARTPRALAALRAKLESEGKPVPQDVLDALSRATARDPKESWNRALHQAWRDPENIARAEAEAAAWAERELKEAEQRRQEPDRNRA